MGKNKYPEHAFFLLIIVISSVFLCASSSCAYPRKHIIEFGGTFGYHYVPNYLEVIVGDTIEWKGDFTVFGLQSVKVPSGALSFNADSVPVFLYVVKMQGEYTYRNPIYYSIGMQGIIFADTISHGLTNEGREFLLGTPVTPPSTLKYSYVYAMINSFYENEVQISYFDSNGHETAPLVYNVAARGFLQIALDAVKMSIDTSQEKAAYKSCHIISKLPITVQCFIVNQFAETYLSLPLISLGKKYVVASYNDNPTGGGNTVIMGPCGGVFLIIASEDGTIIQITPTTTTIGGHPVVLTGIGATGSPRPYTIQLSKGQCYLVRSNGRDEGNDISGSLVVASRPIVVIGGHQEATLGSIFPAGNYLIEQLIPYEYWDSTGYLSIPFAEPIPPSEEGEGDLYRIYSFDTIGFNTHLNVGGISGGYDLTTKRFLFPERFGVTSPVEAFSSNGHKFSIVQYDERMISKPNPKQSPAPCMMTIVPKSRWKKFYSFVVPHYPAAYNYINVISAHMEDIKISELGLAPVPITSLSRSLLFGGISSQDNSLFGSQYKLSIPSVSDKSFPYYLYSEYPFMIFYYQILTFGGGDYEYAAPAGMQLNTGVSPLFKIIIDSISNCTSWHFCVRDTSKDDPGIKTVMLVDDPDGIYFEPGEQLKNVSFDTTLTYMPNELRPQGLKEYCFDVNVINPLQDAVAPVAIVDNGGNAVVLKLFKSATPLKISTIPPTLRRADSIVFPIKKIGEEICTTFVFRNSAPKGSPAMKVISAQLSNKDTSYKIYSVIPSLSSSVTAQDSVTLQVCYTPKDSSRHQDSLILHTDCFNLTISLDAHGSTGLISAGDLDFVSIAVGDTLCKNITIKNVGSAPFTLTKSFVLSDSINFSVDVGKLPIQIKSGGNIQLQVCFHPMHEGSFGAGIDWSTDLEASFAHSVKSHSVLSGQATPKAGLPSPLTLSQRQREFSIHPNPANGNSVVVMFPSLQGSKSTLYMFDVLGREVFKSEVQPVTQMGIPIINLPIGTYYVQLSSSTGLAMKSFMKVK